MEYETICDLFERVTNYLTADGPEGVADRLIALYDHLGMDVDARTHLAGHFVILDSSVCPYSSIAGVLIGTMLAAGEVSLPDFAPAERPLNPSLTDAEIYSWLAE